MVKDLIELINNSEYDKAKTLIVEELKNNDNPDLWYLLFLSENNNYLEFDPNNINNTYAYNQATRSENEEYELEFKLYKELALLGLNKIFRLIQIERYNEVDELLKDKKLFNFKLSVLSTSYLNEIICVNDEIKINYYLKFIDYIYENSNNEQTKRIKDKFYGYFKETGIKKIDNIKEYLKIQEDKKELKEKEIIDKKPQKISDNDIKNNNIYFGRYPQTKVEDTTLISKLNKLAGALPKPSNLGNWKDYNYYSEEIVLSYMYFIDIDLDNDGRYDYRGVYFKEYRPFWTNVSGLFSKQADNGYNVNTIYWFKYEPIKWNILKKENGKAFIISNLILDSQEYYYSENKRNGATDYQGNTTINTVYANNYMYSDIRMWLNTTFYDTVFNDLEKENIETTSVDNSTQSTLRSTNRYICDNTNDKIFLLSYAEANKYYSSNTVRQAQGTDYAKCQGLKCQGLLVKTYSGNSCWLRSPDYYGDTSASYVYSDGNMSDDNVCSTHLGVRAACWIKMN